MKIDEKELEELRKKVYSKLYEKQSKKPWQVISNLYTILTIVIVCVAIIWYINH